jgi:STE24 endopeptidase
MLRLFVLVLVLLWQAGGPALGQSPEPTPQGTILIPDAAKPGPAFDVERATGAYLDSVPADARAKSNAYFEGGYWLRLWGFLYGLGVAGLLLFGRISSRLRTWAERRTRRPWLQTMAYAAGLIVVMTLLGLPLAFYQGWYREHEYALSNLSLIAWFLERGKGLLITVLLGAPLLALVYSVVRKREGNWWLPASVLSVAFMLLVNFIAPVFLAPAFNHFQPLRPGPVRDAVLSLARANGVTAQDVYWFDASKQTTRISANVSGLGNTMRISLNDNLLGKTSQPEINAVMAHELGHYVLNHPFKLVLQMGLVLAAGFAFTQWTQRRLVARWGSAWGLRGPDDIAGLPAVIALLSVWFFLMTPVTNSIVRNAESEADIYGLNAAREPHAFASAAMRLAAYRKLEPSDLEELVFYDHPSGRTRVRMSMTWFAENPSAGAAAR